MPNPEIVVLGTGFAGLTVATRLAEEGHRVDCCGDGRRGASLANFGQLHSGAVYAPVLPELAAACWHHRSRWAHLLETDVPRAPGVAFFSRSEAVDLYTQAWAEIGIPVRALSPNDPASRCAGSARTAAAAFKLPDITVNMTALHSTSRHYAERQGVLFRSRQRCTLQQTGNEVSLRAEDTEIRPTRALVMAVGHHTVRMLDTLGIQHPLAVSHLPYGVLDCAPPEPTLIYWLDGDMLAVSPQASGLHVALPGRRTSVADQPRERNRLAAALSARWPSLPVEKLEIRWGRTAERLTSGPDPSALVVDLSDPPPGWGRAENVVVCLPGKWTTAWHAADQVVQAVATRG